MTPLERFPITWNHVIDKESLKIKTSEQVLSRKSLSTFSEPALGGGVFREGAAKHRVEGVGVDVDRFDLHAVFGDAGKAILRV